MLSFVDGFSGAGRPGGLREGEGLGEGEGALSFHSPSFSLPLPMGTMGN